jgi:hypothetical protein
VSFDPAAWVKANPKPAAVGGGALGVAGIAYYRKRKAASSTGAASSSTTGSTVPAAGTTGSAAYDSSADDVYNSVEGVLEQLQAQIGDLGTASTAAAATTPVSTEPTTAVASAAPTAPVVVDGGTGATSDSIPVNANVEGGSWVNPGNGGPWTQLITAPSTASGAMVTIPVTQATSTQESLANAAAPKSTLSDEALASYTVGPTSYSVIGYTNNDPTKPIYG